MEATTSVKPKQEEQQVEALYNSLLDSWNRQDANSFAELFLEEGYTIGFDGTLANGRKEIYHHLEEVFQHHKTASYVSIVRDTHPLDSQVWVLRADVGMVPPGKNDINPATNAIQNLVAVKFANGFKIAVFQNTPAAFHGRPKDSEKLTNELKKKYGN